MEQDLSAYNSTDLEIWNYLFENQYKNLHDKVCQEYLDCLDRLSSTLNPFEIPDFNKMNKVLASTTGWKIHVVPGLIEVGEFFEHLKNREFCSSTWLRTKKQLNYIEEPDMFHDIFGHVPLLMNQDYANFTQKIGALAGRWKHDAHAIIQLQRLYWFTVEYGVISGEAGTIKCYGAGIISSIEEAHIVAEKKRAFLPYKVGEVIDKEFTIDTIQPVYFVIESFRQLYESLDHLDTLFSKAS